MTVTFNKAPLVELIADLRWASAGVAQPQPNVPMILQGTGGESEQFFMSFGGEVYQHGFRRTERLTPLGFPVFPSTPAIRFRSDSLETSSMLFQLGAGLFSAHALPPYHSWKRVQPTVQIGVEALLKVRPAPEKGSSFSGLSLRYINAFGTALTGGRDTETFAREVFGISLQLPNTVIQSKARPDASVKPHLQFTMPIAGDASVSMLIAEGIVNGEQSVVLDMTVSSNIAIAPDLSAIMAKFTDARNVIHRIFVGLTQPIHSVLEPDGEVDA